MEIIAMRRRLLFIFCSIVALNGSYAKVAFQPQIFEKLEKLFYQKRQFKSAFFQFLNFSDFYSISFKSFNNKWDDRLTSGYLRPKNNRKCVKKHIFDSKFSKLSWIFFKKFIFKYKNLFLPISYFLMCLLYKNSKFYH